MEIQGRIIQVLPLQSGVAKASGKEWKKQDYVIETFEQYPKKICFNLWGDNIDRIGLQVGEDVTVQIDIESREFNGRWYTEVRAWRVDRGLVSPSGAQQPQPQAYQQPAPQQVYPQQELGAGAPNNDLPF